MPTKKVKPILVDHTQSFATKFLSLAVINKFVDGIKRKNPSMMDKDFSIRSNDEYGLHIHWSLPETDAQRKERESLELKTLKELQTKYQSPPPAKASTKPSAPAKLRKPAHKSKK